MAIDKIPPLPDLSQIVDKDGKITPSWRNFLDRMRAIVNETVDAINNS